MRVLLFSGTAGPARNLVRVAARLIDENHEVAAVLLKDPGSVIDDTHSLFREYSPDIVLVSTSSVNIEDELEVMECALDYDVPIAMFADTYGAFWRKDFREADLVDCIDVLFVPDEAEKTIAEARGFRRVVASGVPLWEDLAQKHEDFELARLGGRAQLGVDGHNLISWSSGKNSELNKKTLKEIFAAFREMGEDRCSAIAFVARFHPGDPSLKTPGYYDEVLAECPVRIVDSGMFKKQEDLVPALDLIISSISMLGIAGIYQRRPVIDYLPKDWEDRLEEQTGFRVWPPTTRGASMLVSDPKDLAHSISSLIDESSGLWSKMRDAQVRNYPTAKGRAAETIIRCLEEAVAGQRHGSP